jgi:hypothetical protein
VSKYFVSDRLVLKAGFNPAQQRVPAGGLGAGRFSFQGGSASAATLTTPASKPTTVSAPPPAPKQQKPPAQPKPAKPPKPKKPPKPDPVEEANATFLRIMGQLPADYQAPSGLTYGILKQGGCTGPGPCDESPFSQSRTSNWVARAGGLPKHVRAVAHALIRHGMDESKAIAIAVSAEKKWAGGGKNTKAETRARAAGNVAQWEREKAQSHVTKFAMTCDISKIDEDQHTVFGWAYVTHDEAGLLNVDKSGEYIDDPNELATAAYDFVLESRSGGREHQRTDSGPVVRSSMIESVMFTPEKLEKMGVPEGVLPVGWWVGFKVHDDDTWQGVKDGRWKSFSIHGTGSKMAA